MLQCGLLGERLTHSYSPLIHQELGDYQYDLFEVEVTQLENFIKTTPFHGLNVTIPYKQAAIAYCDALSPVAKAIGSINTILRQADGRLYGDNTDAAGFLTLLTVSKMQVKNQKVLILGSGGSSLTLKQVLKAQGAKEIVVISRSGKNNYHNLACHHDSQLIINTTPVGMYPNNGSSPLDLAEFPSLTGVIDLIYNPLKTALLLQAERLAIPSIGGLVMLVAQAAAAAELFAGKVITWQRINEIVTKIRQKSQNLILVGMPGAGKTTIGKALAQLTGRRLLDTDQMIEAQKNQTIATIFNTAGEQKFREFETAALKQAGKQSGIIIATGGGCVTVAENYELLKQNGVIIGLDRALNQLERTDRPLSQLDLASMYQKRLPRYRQFANRQVANDQTVETVAKKILEVFYETLNY